MKQMVIVFLMFFIFVSSSFGQLQQLWSKQFTFGMGNGQPFSLLVDGSSILASGYAIDGKGGTYEIFPDRRHALVETRKQLVCICAGEFRENRKSHLLDAGNQAGQ